MSFWTEASLEPKRNFRFRITSDGWAEDGDPVWWWAKSVDKPSFDVSNNEYQLINHKFKYPGIVTWKNVTITVVDIANGGPSAVQALETELGTIGYTRPDKDPMKGVAKTNQSNVDGLLIQHLNAHGKPVDTFKLVGAFIVSTSHSKLDYSDDAITETTLEIAYDYAEYSGLIAKPTKTSGAQAATGVELPEGYDPNFYKNWEPPSITADFLDPIREGNVTAEAAITD